MASKAGKKEDANRWKPNRNKRKQKKTSIGRSKNSRPVNKNKRRINGITGYRGQG